MTAVVISWQKWKVKLRKSQYQFSSADISNQYKRKMKRLYKGEKMLTGPCIYTHIYNNNNIYVHTNLS